MYPFQVMFALQHTDTPVRMVTSAPRQSGSQHQAMRVTVMAQGSQKAACAVIKMVIWLTAMGIPGNVKICIDQAQRVLLSSILQVPMQGKPKDKGYGDHRCIV